jgi:hypothetical protein
MNVDSYQSPSFVSPWSFAVYLHLCIHPLQLPTAAPLSILSFPFLILLLNHLLMCLHFCMHPRRLRSHSCLQLARPSRQPPLAPEFSLTSPAPSPRRLHPATRHHHQQQQQRGQLARSASTPTPNTSPRGTGRAAGKPRVSTLCACTVPG